MNHRIIPGIYSIQTNGNQRPKHRYRTISQFQNLGFCSKNEVVKQVGSTCYAYAAADITRMIYARIVGMQPPDHQLLVDLFTKEQGFNGGHSDICLKNIPKVYTKSIKLEEALKAIVSRPILLSWYFT